MTHEEQDAPQSYRDLLRLRTFRTLWMSQTLSQTAKNGIHFVQVVMIDRLTHSSSHVGIMILAFTIPAVIFSALSGIVVDRFSRKRIMIWSNALRILTALSYVFALTFLHGRSLLLWIYLITFCSSALGQFFGPALAAVIPQHVPKRALLLANSLFNITLIATQIFGLLVVFPLVIKVGQALFGVDGGLKLAFLVIALMYAIATWLLTTIPPDQPPRLVGGTASWRKTVRDFREGWAYIRRLPVLWVPLINLTLTALTIMIMALLAPGFAARVLHVNQEDAVYIFAPAGAGLFLGTVLIGRYGGRWRRETLSNTGLVLIGVALGALGLAGWQAQTAQRLVILMTSAISFVLGGGFAMVGIPSQTMLQERTTPHMRGRVFAAQFMAANIVGMPPMLLAGWLADRFGIPTVAVLVGILVLVVATITVALAHRYHFVPTGIAGFGRDGALPPHATGATSADVGWETGVKQEAKREL
ncbi:MAG: MFS transporter [Ardenticatenia bacterium]|nr:MAG: MFS transporter [Ardenticatenia bacterium]